MKVSEPRISPLRAGLSRVTKSAVAWSWLLNGLRLAGGLILLPLLLHKLSNAEYGMYIVFLSLTALVPLLDFGFGPSIGRFVSYAMAGAQSLQSHGLAKAPGWAPVNYELLWQLLFTTQRLYRYLSLVAVVVLATWGTYNVEYAIHETNSILLTRAAWVAALAAALLDIYSTWWVTFLRSMDQVLVAAQIAAAAMVLRLVIAADFLMAGAGLLSVPLATLLGSALQRFLARRHCLRAMAAYPAPAVIDVKAHLRVLWPNTWRLGLQFFSGYLTVNANITICQHVMKLGAVQQYGLSAQLLTILAGMAAVWTSVKWPLIGQFRAREDYASLRGLFWPRVWLQNLTFVLGAAALLALAPPLLSRFGNGKELLPFGWLCLMVTNAFLEMQFNIWGTLISTENRLPYLWPTVASNVLSLVLSWSLIRFTSLGLGALVLGPLIAGSLFNYWYWPWFAARGIGTNLFRFLFAGPLSSRARPEMAHQLRE